MRRSLALFLLLWPAGLPAQLIRGRVVGPDSARPVAGAVIQLADSAGTLVGRTLSGEDGRFSLRAAHAGSHSLRTLRIGFRPATFGPYDVPATGLSTLTLVLRDLPVALAEVHVEGNNACLRAREHGSDGGVLAVWEAARTALLASVLARSQEQVTVTTTTYERVTAPRTERIKWLRVSQRSGQSIRPFISPRIPDEYAELGYMERHSDGAVYHAPDADVLLSESFAAVHCLRLARDPRDGEVGVSFEPVPDNSREQLVDVSGTLWLDRRTAALRRLEFGYTGLEPAQVAGGAGGHLSFQQLATGAWVVTDWLVRVPRFEVVRAAGASRDPSVHTSGSLLGREERRVLEVWNFGGELARAAVGDRLLWRAPDATVTGRVHDAEGVALVPGTRVSLAGTTYSATSDSLGRFRLGEVLPGRYDVRVLSPFAAALDLAPDDAGVVDARADSTATVELRVPRDDELLARRCGSGASGDRGYIAGTAWLAANVPARDANVSAKWQSIGGGAPALTALEMEAVTRTDSLGRFGLCGIPRARVIALSAFLDSTNLRTRAKPTAFISKDSLVTAASLLLEPPRTIALTGDVREEGGRALPGTVVEAIGGVQTRTDSAGRFVLRVEVPGTYLIRARRIGHLPAVRPLAVGDGDAPAPFAFTLRASLAELDTVAVRARATGGLADPGAFARRSAAGLGGTFLREEDIARRGAHEAEEILRAVPNVRVGVGGIVSLNRGAVTLKGTPCQGAQLFVDGSEMPDNFDVNQVPPSSIRGIEVYSGVGTTPPELRSARQVCGTIAIWTK